MATAPMRCPSLFYNGLQVGDRRLPGPRSDPLATKASSWLHEAPDDPSAGPQSRAVWPQRSGGQAASLGTRSGNEGRELRSNSRARPREFGTRTAYSTTVAPESRYGFGSFLRAEGPKRLLTLTELPNPSGVPGHHSLINGENYTPKMSKFSSGGLFSSHARTMAIFFKNDPRSGSSCFS